MRADQSDSITTDSISEYQLIEKQNVGLKRRSGNAEPFKVDPH